MIKNLFILILITLFCACKKSGDSPKTILSVQVLQDSIPVEGAIVSLSLSTNETRPEFQDRLTDKNGIVNFSGVENKYYKVYAYKDCSYQLRNDGIDLSNVQTGTTMPFTTHIFFRGVVKVINKTPYTQIVNLYNNWSATQKYVSSNDSIIYPYTHSSKDPEIDTQQHGGPGPWPRKSYDLPAICGDTAVITLN